MTRYQQAKAAARDRVQEWQADFSKHNYSYGEIAAFQDMFYRLGKRYGLLTEYRENGII